MNNKELFSRLVENALDFLSRSTSDLERSPKYSAIHFYAAVELFVKARLMSEHWSLVVSKRQDPDWEKFVAGDFYSVSLEEAATKLKKAVRSGLSESELKAFREVGNHRNKMVHFFHEAHSAAENDKLRTRIAREQLRAWYLLHRLLTDRWRDVFEAWSHEISAIDAELRKHRKYLQIIYDHLRSDIEERKREGYSFATCPSCEFEAQQYGLEVEGIYAAVCLVCGFQERRLEIECPRCGASVRFTNEGFSVCSSCNKRLEPEDVVAALRDDEAAFAAARAGDNSWDEGNCSNCDGYHTVVRTADAKYVCASCFEEFQSLQPCEWCNELNTGDMEHSYLMGCSACEGKVG